MRRGLFVFLGVEEASGSEEGTSLRLFAHWVCEDCRRIGAAQWTAESKRAESAAVRTQFGGRASNPICRQANELAKQLAALIGGLVGEVDEIVNGPLAIAIEFMDISCRFDLTDLEIATFGAGAVEDLLHRAISAEPVNALAAAARSNTVLRSAIDSVWIDADSVRSSVWDAFTNHFGDS